jgi:hypothetical protein
MLTITPSAPRPNLLETAWKSNQGLSALAIISLVLIVGSSLGLMLDPRTTEFLGTPTWVKTFKFSVSTLFYSLGLLWILALAKQPNATRLGGMIGWILSFELGLLVLQGARATPMHFNYSSPLNSAIWMTMTAGIAMMMLGFVVLCVLVWRNLKSQPVLATGVRLGLLVTALGLAQGNLMPAPTPAQLEALQNGKTLAILGAHTVGSPSLTPDNGAGLPLVGWSTTHGDLRIGHFVGIHALQVIPLLGLWLSKRRNLNTKKGVRLVWIGALAYLGLVMLVTWQALRGQSIIAPDTTTLAALAALVFGAAVSSLLVWKQR